MPFAECDDDVRLYFESEGSGTPVVFVHEFGGNHWSWEPPGPRVLEASPLHHLCRPGLSAFRCSRRRRSLFPEARCAGHHGRSRCLRPGKRPPGRAFDGRFCGAPCGHFVARKSALAGRCRNRLRRRKGSRSVFPGRFGRGCRRLRARRRGVRGGLCRGRLQGSVPGQGLYRLASFRRAARQAFGEGGGQHHARGPGPAALAL